MGNIIFTNETASLSYFWGKKSQSIGRKPVFVIGLFSYAIAYALFAFGIQIGLWGLLASWQLFSLLFVIRLLYGGLIGGIQPAATAYMSDSTDANTRIKGMALIGMASGIGTMIGPIIGGALVFIHPIFPMYFGAGIAVLGGILAMIFLIEPLKQAPVSEPVNLKFYDKRIMPYLIGWALVFLVFTSTQVIAAFFIEDQLGVSTQSEIIKATSISLLSMALTTTLMQAVVLQIINVSPRTLLRLCFFIFGAVLFVIPMVKSLGYFYLSFAGIGIAFSMVTPGLNSAATLSVETHEQGEVAGLLAAAPVVGMIFGPTIGALLYTADPGYPFLFGSLIAIALGIYFQFLNIPKTKH